jgi:hypothetical protein
MGTYRAFFGKYLPGADIGDSFYESGYVIAEGRTDRFRSP